MANKHRKFDALYAIVGVPWLFLMLFTSGEYTAIKTVLLAVLSLLSFIEIQRYRFLIKGTQLRYVIVFVTFCFISLLYGILLGYDFSLIDDLPLIQSCIFTPIIVILLSTAISYYKHRVSYLWEVLKYLALLLVALDVVKLVLYTMGIEPFWLEFIKISSGKTIDELSLRVANEHNLFFLTPIFIYLLINPNKHYSRKDRIIYLLIVIFSIVYSVLSVRKMLIIGIAFSFLFSIIFTGGKLRIGNLFTGKMILFYFITLLLIPVFFLLFDEIAALIGVDDLLGLAGNTLSEGLSSNSYGVEKRTSNTMALLEMWQYSPIWGHGINSYVPGEVAAANKWSYEVIYVAWLMQTGILGVILLFGGVRYILKRLKRVGIMTGNTIYYAVYLGFLYFVIAGASNPLVYLVWPWTIAIIFGNQTVVEDS